MGIRLLYFIFEDMGHLTNPTERRGWKESYDAEQIPLVSGAGQVSL